MARDWLLLTRTFSFLQLSALYVYRQRKYHWILHSVDKSIGIGQHVLITPLLRFYSTLLDFRGHVVAWMERYRIGNLSPEDAKKARDFNFGDMYETDPVRDPNNLPCTEKPWCGEPRIDLLTKDYITPNELFYVRNHLAVPDLDEKEYTLIVKGKGIKKHTSSSSRT